MKKVLIYTTVLTLAACGGTDSSNVEVNEGEQSSLVANTNPETTSEQPNNDTENTNQSSEQVNDGKNTSIEYFESNHDFGNVFYPSENLYTFKFKNTGSEPLIIEDAKASCGCTVPNKPEEPVLPGEIGELDVIFRPKQGQVGQTVTKRVTVTANTVPRETFLDIKATVMDGM